MSKAAPTVMMFEKQTIKPLKPSSPQKTRASLDTHRVHLGVRLNIPQSLGFTDSEDDMGKRDLWRCLMQLQAQNKSSIKALRNLSKGSFPLSKAGRFQTLSIQCWIALRVKNIS